jgi:hypothetical protein
MNLIDETYFTGTIALPGLKKNITGGSVTGAAQISQTVGEINLIRFIEEYQEEYLNIILGKSLTAAFFEGLSLPDGNPGKEMWITLKNQLVNEKGRRSPIANYVYYFIMCYGKTQTSPTGEKRAKSDFAQNRTGFGKMLRAWNKMVKWNMEFIKWLSEIKNLHTYEKYAGNHTIDPDNDLFRYVNYENLYTK